MMNLINRTVFCGYVVVGIAGALASSSTGVATEPPKSATAPSAISRTVVFSGGQHGYRGVRIPAIAKANDGTLLAFCEGRRNGLSDVGDIDIILRRSTDGGSTWEGIQTIWDDGSNTCGNPCVVVDRTTGHIWLLLTWNAGNNPEPRVKPGFGTNSRRVFVTHSTDNGVTWAQPSEITTDVKAENWSWYATGPGAGIQMEQGKYRGRMVVPCDHKSSNAEGSNLYYSHVIFSDDHGVTWQHGEPTPRDQVNECEVVELEDGRLLLNMRNFDHTVRARQVAYSNDGGATWHDQHIDKTLIEPTCQASLRRHSWTSGDQPGILLFSNPADERRRVAMTLRASFDEGKTWPAAVVLNPASSAYSCLVSVNDREIGCLYERNNYSEIVFDRVSIDALRQSETASD